MSQSVQPPPRMGCAPATPASVLFKFTETDR
jgi:hypothetical protein